MKEDIAEDPEASGAIKRLEQQLAACRELAAARAKQLRALTLELIGAEERERRRIAGILHVDLQQVLFGARLQLQSAMKKDGSPPLLKNLDALLKQAIALSRNLSHRIDPSELHRLDLEASLTRLAREYQSQFGLTTSLTIDSPVLHDPMMKILIFRAVEELLFNVVKHSGARRADIGLSSIDGNLVLTVKDQGIGCCPDITSGQTENRGLGLIRLQERVRALGGEIVITGSPGNGCRCALTIPFAAQ